jgi:hypothetical protein
VVTSLWLVMTAWAVPSADLRIDPPQMVEGQTGTVTVSVRGADPTGVPRITAPAGVDVQYVGQSQAMSVIQGKAERHLEFQFQIGVHQQGSFTIGPAVIPIAAGQTLTSDVEALRVGAAPVIAATQGQFTVHTTFTPTRAWQGQVVLFHYGWQARAPVVSTDWFGLPSDGVVLVRDSSPMHKGYALDDPGGSGTVWFDDTVAALTTMKPGTLHWDAPIARLEVSTGKSPRGFGLFRRTEQHPVRGDALDLEILPLPAPPADFSGLVGDFVFEARVDAAKAQVGASLAWTLELVGDGPTDTFKPSATPELVGARLYEAAPEARGALNDSGWKGFLTLKRTVVPTREGMLQLPETRVVVFSTSKGEYVTLSAPARQLLVQPGEHGEVELTSFGTSDGEASAPAEDPNALRPAWTSGPGTVLPWAAVMPFALGLASLPSLLPLLSAAGAAWFARREQARAVRPPRGADLLAALPTDPAERLTALDGAIRLAWQGVPKPEDGGAALPEDLAAELNDLVAVLDVVRFAGRAAPPDLEPRVTALVAALDARRPA